MKELLTLQGGYPRQMDYILNLQSELYTLGNGLFSALGVDLVLSGCAVHDNGNGTVNIAAGLVYVAGEAIRFDAANNIVANGSLAMAKGPYTPTDQKTFADGSLKNVYREAKAVIANATGSIAEIKIRTKLYDLKQYIQDAVQSFEVRGTIKEVYDFDGSFRANFDGGGLGITPRWIGWALDNANNGTPGSEGMVIVAAGTFTDTSTGEQTEFAIGDKGGEVNHRLTVNEMPAHDHGDGKGLSGYGTHSGNPDSERAFIRGAGRTDSAGGGQEHNNMPPFGVAYRVVKIV
ncbi:hypothetical protein [Mucilaginibacter lappiensis]|uniref:Microcystin-dependent protein n=1 Tax=Mucilaginibacter lappiensis TaxID=354630 RepID=A0A841JRC5_9SPHI|nr:hypothetical protein [Mucilaginibacter lappiensis]MBB6131318.1 hypothetical protein [Mucilaginibacter lappiensis]